MAAILGLSVSHHPFTRFKPHLMPSVLIGNIENGWKEKHHLKDPKNWPEPMREEWGMDRGSTVGKRAQDHQIEVIRKLKVALDEFRPDFMVCIHRDQLGGRESADRPQYWIQAHEKADVQFYQLGNRRENYFDEDPDRPDTVLGHREGGLYLAEGLRKAGLNPRVFDQPTSSAGLGSHALAGIFHLDWDKREFKTPVVPLSVDPWGFGRRRNNEGLSPWDRGNPNPPLTPKEGFELGGHMARIYKDSPWRVALVASTAWAGAHGSAFEDERIQSDIEADEKLYDEWRNNRFTAWGDRFTWEEFERHGQWELLSTIILAGAMTEIGAEVEWSDFTSHYVLNSSWVSTVFGVK